MSDSEDYSRGFGGEALAARLRRASERMDRDGARVYAARGIRFEQRWYGVLRQLVEHDRPMGVGEIATILRITHVSVSEASRSMEKAGLVVSRASAEDGRRRLMELTEEGRAMVARLAPLWEAFNATARELDAEAGEIVRLLDRLDDALDRKSMFERIMARISLDEPEIDANM
ncbi:MarR family winged helix-turn-helix transcriptional regulator [Caulobacter endophyticus]|uniref:MarR family winged helix-turn-helix transcriptional regulator n=1 Tax=Caulobacter endophyticus TaxID=2172652 RepID=UPI0024104189|nr:MarR family transcriptional regulator [Caulobacter endophyticus]MDG2530617.1 MarR family transcriptional regulator [Caulobacter endophyticus]